MTLPILPLQVPQAPSIALLLLYALGVHTNPSALAAALLPLSVAEEFPSAAAMAQAMAAHCERENNASEVRSSGGGARSLERYMLYNQGMWKNVLALGLQDSRVMSVVQTVWNVTAESRKIMARQWERRRELVLLQYATPRCKRRGTYDSHTSPLPLPFLHSSIMMTRIHGIMDDDRFSDLPY